MKNQICRKQNDELQLKRLAAQRQMYADAKQIQAIQLMLSVPFVIVAVAIASLQEDLHVYAALFGLVVVLLDLWLLTPKVKALKKRAARTQQLFDIEVLDLDWNEFLLGNKPSGEKVVQFAGKYEKRTSDLSDLRDWYSVAVAEVNIGAARILCQRANLSWDTELRRRYLMWLLWGFLTVCGIVTLIGIAGELTLTNLLLTIVIPLQPALLYTTREIQSQRETCERLNLLMDKALSVWDDILRDTLSKTTLKEKAQEMQSALLEHRQTCPLIFDWIYNKLLKQDEEAMKKNTEYLVTELRDAGRLSS